ncbi:MAG: hypothetical protein QOI42_1302 [Frankiaceae bacterium]|nr:hypothetical protein [Frankiaceae bacterium]
MEHVVFYTGLDGVPAFRRVESLSEAVSLVEYLRNAKNVHDTSVFSLSEVPLEFRPYYRADVPTEAYDAVADDLPGVVIGVEGETDASAPHIALVPDLTLERPPLEAVADVDVPRLAGETVFAGIDRHAPAEPPDGMFVPSLAVDDDARLATVVQLHPHGDATTDQVAEAMPVEPAQEHTPEPTTADPEPVEPVEFQQTQAVEATAVEAAVEATASEAAVEDDVDHLGALAELAAQVAEESATDAVDEEELELRTEPEAFAPEADVPAPIEAQALELEVADAEAELAEVATTDNAPALDTEPAPVEVLVVSDETISQLLAEQSPVAPTMPAAQESVSVEPVALAPIVAEPLAVEPLAVEPLAVEPLAVEPIVAEPLAVESVVAEPLAVEPVAAPEPAGGVPAEHLEPVAAAGHSRVAVAVDVPPLTEEELASVPEVPNLPAARTVSPETGTRREGARTLGFFAR